MSFYSKLKATATSLLTKFGQTVTITRSTVGAYDPALGSAAVTTSTLTGKGALFEYAALSGGASEINGTTILDGDKKLLLSASITPQVNDTVLVNGRTYTIKGIKDTNPAGTAVMFECNLRGA